MFVFKIEFKINVKYSLLKGFSWRSLFTTIVLFRRFENYFQEDLFYLYREQIYEIQTQCSLCSTVCR